jgi:hypothetical protein
MYIFENLSKLSSSPTFKNKQVALRSLSPGPSNRLHGPDLVADEVVANDKVALGDVNALLSNVGGDEKVGTTGPEQLKVHHFLSICHLLLTHQTSRLDVWGKDGGEYVSSPFLYLVTFSIINKYLCLQVFHWFR